MSKRRGPAPMPTAMRRARGKSGKRRKDREIPGREPMPDLGAPLQPLGLDKDAAKCWKMMERQLTKMKVLTKADGVALEGLARAYANAVQLDKDVNARGFILIMWDGRRYANPAVNMARQAWMEVRKFAQEFGLTPSSRTRVREAPDEGRDKGHEEDAESFLFGKHEGRVVGNIGR